MAKGRVMSEQTKRYVLRPDGNSRASLPSKTGTYSRINLLARDARQKAGKGKMVGIRTGVTEEGAA
jgi:hypothetical protein